MRYSTGEWGTYLCITKDTGEIYGLLVGALKYKNAVASKEFATFLSFLGSTPYFSIDNGSKVRVWCDTSDDGEVIFDLIVLKGEGEDFDQIIKNLDEDSFEDIDSKLLWDMYLDYKKEQGTKFLDMMELGSGVDKKSQALRKKLRCQKVIYKVRPQDIINLKDYIDYYFISKGQYYVAALPGVMLDEFYERAQIKESEVAKYLKKSLAIQN